MNPRGVAAGVVMLVLVSVAPPIAAQEDAGDPPDGFLYAHWADEGGPVGPVNVPMDPRFPAGEPNLSTGPAQPSMKSCDCPGEYSLITYSFVNTAGVQGPPAALDLDPSRPAVLYLYLAADQVGVPTFVPLDPDQNPDWGVSPTLTVEANMLVGGEVVATGMMTQTIVSLPGDVAHEYAIPFETGLDSIEPGVGIDVVWEVYHHETPNDDRVELMHWNSFTGEEYPTGLQLPVLNPENLTAPINITTNVTEDLNLTSVEEDDDGLLGIPLAPALAPLALALAVLAVGRRP